MWQYIERSIEEKIARFLKSFPTVYIGGPRQSGKTTLVRQLAKTRHPAQYITFDDLQFRSAVKEDPDSFLRSLKGNVVLDEIQLIPEIFRPLKVIIDENRQSENGGRGKFLLTGSANIMALPKLCDALAGRVCMQNLLPLSAIEISNKRKASFIDQVFSGNVDFDMEKEMPLDEILKHTSYPELLAMDDALTRKNWCNSYLQSVLQRDVHALLEVQKLMKLPQMLNLIATRTGGLLNETSLARDLDLNYITTRKYRILLESLFLTLPIPAWQRNPGKRLIKTPKVYLGDINLLIHLLGVDQEFLHSRDRIQVGRIIENFVAVELTKQIAMATTTARLYHYRTSSQQEVDFVLESQRGQVIGIEVKSTSKVTARDFRNLKTLKSEIGSGFECGFVTYPGNDFVQFGNRLYALPLASL